MRQIAEIVGCSPATVCRRLRVMEGLGVFQRARVRAGGRYRYTIAEPYRRALNLRSAAAEAAVSLVKRSVSGWQPGVAEAATQEAEPPKQSIKKEDAPASAGARAPIGSETFKWRARLRQLREYRLWSESYGPLPSELGCKAPPELLAEMLGLPASIKDHLLCGTAILG